MKSRYLLLVFVWITASVSAAEYYVSPSGDNRANGSRDRPYRNIQRALAAARQPGDTIIVRGGTYTPSSTLNLSNSGNPNAFITLRAEVGEAVIVDGRLMAPNSNVLSVLVAYVRVQGLTIRGAKASGLVAWGPGTRTHHVEFLNNTVEACEMGGIYAGTPNPNDPVSDILIEGNTVTQTSLRNAERKPGTTWAFGVGGGMTKNIVIRNNTVFENHGEGVGLYLSDGGVVQGNRVYDNFAVNIYLDNTTQTVVYQNLSYSTGKESFFRFGYPTNGIQVANETYPQKQNLSSGNQITNNLLLFNGVAFYVGSYQQGGGFRNSVFANNTCYGSVRDMVLIDPDPGHQNSRIERNIFVQVDNAPMANIEKVLPGVTFSSNLWMGSIPPRPGARSVTDLFTDPGFMNPGGFEWKDYRLKLRSPAQRMGIRDIPD